MRSLSDALAALIGGEATAFFGLGILVATGLIVALRLLLPVAARPKLRLVAILTVAHVVFVLLTAMAEPQSLAHRSFRLTGLFCLLIALGRGFFLLLADSGAAGRLARPIPKIFRDILEGLVYVAAILVTLRQAGVQLDALITTSALLTAVIGLSLQDTLGNLFAGLAIQAQNPFEVGDWIQFDENKELVGRVVEINWRATKVVTLDDVEVVIPNGPLARAPIRNYNKPEKASRRSIRVVVPFTFAPHTVHDAIRRGLRGVDGVLSHPRPSVLTEDFGARGVCYWIRFHLDDFDQREVIDAQVRDRIWYALHRAGMEFAVPVGELDITQVDESAHHRARAEATERRESALRNVDFLDGLDEAQRRTLATHAHERPYAAGERVINAGEVGDEFFIVVEGELIVSLESDGRAVEVARLGPGSFFGEMSVMTGEPRNANVETIHEARILVVEKEAFANLLKASPEVAEHISEVLASRQVQLDSASSKTDTPMLKARTEQGVLLTRIRKFFSLSGQSGPPPA